MANMIKRSEVNRIMRESGQVHPLLRLHHAALRLLVADRVQGAQGRSAGDHRPQSAAGTSPTTASASSTKTGLFLFTVRNGNNADLSKGRGMLYAEKAMISRKDQYSPDAPPQPQGRGHHQPRRRHAGDRALRRHRRQVRSQQGRDRLHRRHPPRAAGRATSSSSSRARA